MLFTQCIGESYVTFLGPENFVLFEKHQKAFSGALRGAFRAREVLGSFEKRTPASVFWKPHETLFRAFDKAFQIIYNY